MTLLTFARGSDGFVIVSDRKETNSAWDGEVQKYFMPKDRGIFLALAGDGSFNKWLFNRLHGYDDARLCLEQIRTLRRAYFAEHQSEHEPNFVGHSSGFAVMSGEKHALHKITFDKDELDICCVSDQFDIIGEPAAKTIVGHILQNVNFLNSPSEVLAKYLVASTHSASDSVRSVGGTGYGFDVVAFMNDGRIVCRRRYSDGRTRARISFESAPGAMLSESAPGGV